MSPALLGAARLGFITSGSTGRSPGTATRPWRNEGTGTLGPPTARRAAPGLGDDSGPVLWRPWDLRSLWTAGGS